MLGHLRHLAPEVFTARASNSSIFKCSNTYVGSFLKQHLNFVPCMATCTAQKVPSDADAQMRRSCFRVVYTTWAKKIWHAVLWLNFDQTQVIVQSIGNSTFAELGSKQVLILGKEERRAWTAVVAVSASGEALPIQIIMKGKTKKSIPWLATPFMAGADSGGFVWGFNPDRYWLGLKLMKQYIKVCFFCRLAQASDPD
jgi:hypothetical protein